MGCCRITTLVFACIAFGCVCYSASQSVLVQEFQILDIKVSSGLNAWTQKIDKCKVSGDSGNYFTAGFSNMTTFWDTFPGSCKSHYRSSLNGIVGAIVAAFLFGGMSIVAGSFHACSGRRSSAAVVVAADGTTINSNPNPKMTRNGGIATLITSVIAMVILMYASVSAEQMYNWECTGFGRLNEIPYLKLGPMINPGTYGASGWFIICLISAISSTWCCKPRSETEGEVLIVQQQQGQPLAYGQPQAYGQQQQQVAYGAPQQQYGAPGQQQQQHQAYGGTEGNVYKTV